MKNPREILEAELAEGEKLLWWGRPLPPPGETSPSKTLYGISTDGIIVVSPARFLSSRPYKVFSQSYGSPAVGEPFLDLWSDGSGTISFLALATPQPDLPKIWGDDSTWRDYPLAPQFENIPNAKAVYELLCDARQKYLDSGGSPEVPSQAQPEIPTGGDTGSWALSDFIQPRDKNLGQAVPSSWEERARIFPWGKFIVAALLLGSLFVCSLLVMMVLDNDESVNPPSFEWVAALSLVALMAILLLLWARPRIGWLRFAPLLAAIWIAVPIITLLVQGGATTRDAGVLLGQSAVTSEAPGPSIPYAVDVLTARSRPVFGPQAGSIARISDETIDWMDTEVELRDFIADARFHNPRSCGEGPWDFGFIFRSSAGKQYRLIVDCRRGWGFGPRIGSGSDAKTTSVTGGNLSGLNTSVDGSNCVRLVAEGEYAHFMLNSEHVATLDISQIMSSGTVIIAAGFYRDNKVPDKSTRYEGLTISAIDNSYGGASADGAQAKSLPASEGRIAFSTRSNDQEKWSVNIVNPDGSGLRRLTGTAQGGGTASWSPDGTKLAWDGYQSDKQVAIFVMNEDGTGLRRITRSSGNKMAPRWSPDGKRLVFASADEKDKSDIWVINADGTGEVRLTDHQSSDQYPDWSPDSRRIVFQSDRDGNNEIYVMDADGGNQRRLTNDPSNDGNPAWSTEGDRIAFTSSRGGRSGIYVMRADGSEVTRITPADQVSIFPTWSPTGKRIAFSSPIAQAKDKSTLFNLFAINTDGTGMTRITSGPNMDLFPHWGR